LEKIDPSGLPSRSYRKRKKSGTVKDTNSIPQTGFGETLESMGIHRVHPFRPLYENESLEEMLDDVHEYGDRLKNRPTLSAIREYRDVVTKFMRYVVSRSLSVESTAQSHFNPLKSRKKYAVIQVINAELDKLANGVLQNQYDQMRILSTVEEINGMLVDLMK
jgi:uncharacterized protein